MDDCIFCKIAKGEIPSIKVYEDESALAFHDISPQAPVHIVVIPKKHFESVLDADETAFMDIGRAAVAAAKAEGCEKSGFRLVINTGKDAGQTVPHIHAHLLAGRELAWPPG